MLHLSRGRIMLISILPSYPLNVAGYATFNPGGRVPIDEHGNYCEWTPWFVLFNWDDGGATKIACKDLYDACKKLHIYSLRVMTEDTQTLVELFRLGHIG